MSRRLIVAGLAGLAVLVIVVLALGGGDDAAPETPAASGSTTIAVAAEPDASATTTAAPEGTTTQAPVDDETEEVVAATETTTLPTTTTAAPIEERLPRTEAEATESDPVPVGEVIEAAPGLWDIALTAVDMNATDVVLAFADINPKPEPGFQYVLVTIEGTYLGDRVAQPVFEWAVVSGETEYWPSIPGCGVVPDSLYDVIEVAPNQSFFARVCMPVASQDVEAGLELFLHAPGDDPRYFSLG